MLGLPYPPIRARARYDLPKREFAITLMLQACQCSCVVGEAGGSRVAQELAEAGLSVVLLERGQWFTSFDDRKDDPRNQRTCVLGNSFGPDERRNPRVYVDANR